MGLYRQSGSLWLNLCDSTLDSLSDSIWCKLCSASCLFHVGDAYRQWGLGALLSNSSSLRKTATKPAEKQVKHHNTAYIYLQLC